MHVCHLEAIVSQLITMLEPHNKTMTMDHHLTNIVLLFIFERKSQCLHLHHNKFLRGLFATCTPSYLVVNYFNLLRPVGHKGGKGRGGGGVHATNPMYSSGGFPMQTTPSYISMCLHHGLHVPFLNSTNNWWYGCCPTSIRNLYLQIYNSTRDNKNQCIMSFLFMLTAQKVFQEIQNGFLLFGYTPKDIDGYFNNLFKQPKTTTHLL